MLVNLVSTNNVVIYNVTFQNSPMFNIFLENVNTAHISQVNVLAPGSHDPNGPSHNTDGIDVANSQNVLVEFSYISVGEFLIVEFRMPHLIGGEAILNRRGAWWEPSLRDLQPN
jgi:polygalacturonase